MSQEDIADRMIAAWNDPFATQSDPRFLLIEGAKEIRALRREVAASRAVVRTLHSINEEMSQELRRRRPNPDAPIYIAGLAMAGVCLFVLWALVR